MLIPPGNIRGVTGPTQTFATLHVGESMEVPMPAEKRRLILAIQLGAILASPPAYAQTVGGDPPHALTHGAPTGRARLWRTSSEPSAATTDARRVVALEGQSNFRDLGGYETLGGRHVKWGLIYRSGELSELTAADYRRLSSLGIRTVYDLRDAGERARQPTAWAAGPVRSFASPKPEGVAGSVSFRSDSRAAQAQLADFYAKMPDRYAGEYRVIFRELVAGRAPLLLHCTGGKDRSGLASALILTALGVPRASVVADYQLTDQLLKPSRLPAKTSFMQQFARLPPDVQAVIVRADPPYLAAAFNAIDTEYGSVNGYLDKALGVGPKQIATLRKLYLY
jgi:protein-tyrosine phosphatase